MKDDTAGRSVIMLETAQAVRDVLLIIAMGLGMLVTLPAAIAALIVLKKAQSSRRAIATGTSQAKSGARRALGRVGSLARKKQKKRNARTALLRPLSGIAAVATGVVLALATERARGSRMFTISRIDAVDGKSVAVDVEPRRGPVLADGSAKKPPAGLKDLAIALKDAFQKDDLGTHAASLAYRFFLALFPFFIFLAALAGFVAAMLDIENPTDRIIDLLQAALPQDAATLIGDQLGQVVANQNPGLLSIGIIGAIWAASSGIQSLIKAMNVAYDVPETRKFWKKYAIAVGLTILSGAFVISAVAVLISGQFFAEDIAGALGIPEGWAGTLFRWTQWPLMIALLMLGIAFLYWACPNIKLPFKIATPGAVIFVIAWIIASVGFSFYVANFGNYNATYGALGGVVILLVWMYFTSLLLLIGAEINAIVDDRADPDLMARNRLEKHEAANEGRKT